MNSIHYQSHHFGVGMVVCCWKCNRLLFIQIPNNTIDSREITYMLPFKQRSRHQGFKNENKRYDCSPKSH
jgi:hypothetical protein